MVKKLVLTIMAVVMVTGCAACNGAEKNSASTDTNQTVVASNNETKSSETDSLVNTNTVDAESELPEDYEDDLYNIELNRLHIGSAGLAALTFYVENNSNKEFVFGNDLSIEKLNANGEWEKLENVTATGDTVQGKEFKDVEVTINSDSVIGNGSYKAVVMGMEIDFIIDSFEE